MNELLELLKDGHARSLEMLAIELDTTVEDIKRRIEYLERMNIIRRVSLGVPGCGTCSGCEGSRCEGCMPQGGFRNMGEMWEIV
ncbi:MAG: Lrp/AsnC family transcriptional regulator [Ruminococcus sp.]|nr:Lrp/AsnC family transcriptional regulator [Ruminococcus sp.]MBR1863816.1 Lrp/AsnC family transcriptional regulator [Ruminococcus sp.]